MADEFELHPKGLTSPATKHFAIAPDDNADLPLLPRLIYCQVDGNIVIRDEAGVDLSYSMIAGDRLEFRGVRVLSTGTTGTFYGWA